MPVARLTSDALRVPGFAPGVTGLVVASRSGATIDRHRIDVLWGPADIVSAWERGDTRQVEQSS